MIHYKLSEMSEPNVRNVRDAHATRPGVPPFDVRFSLFLRGGIR